MKKQLANSILSLLRIPFICAIVFIAGAINSMAAPPPSPLCGTYAIGGVAPDYNNLTDAINALNTYGVSCAVIFNIRAGSYAAGQTINSISGSSASNTVTFQSESGIAANVTLTSSAFDITMNNASNVSFSKLTFYANNVYGDLGGIYLNNYTTDVNIKVDGCIFNVTTGGFYFSYGIYNYYAEASGLQVTNCTFNAWRPVFMYGYAGYPNQNILVADNVMTGAHYGIYGDLLGSIQVLRNQINCDFPFIFYIRKGISLSYVTSLKVEKNKISTANTAGAHGIYIENCSGSSSSRNSVINNFIEVGGTLTSVGIYAYSSVYLDVLHNSVNLINTNVSSSSYNRYNGDHMAIANNIFANTGGGRAIYVAGSDPTIDYNYNDYYATGANLGNKNGTDAVDLAAWQALYGMDANSISVNPMYASATNLHVSNAALNNAGVNLSIADDIDGDLRSSTPDIGADEFNPVVTSVPTLSQWGLIALGGLVLLIGGMFVRKMV